MLVALLTYIKDKLVTDHELMKDIAQKEERALEILYDRHSKLMYSLILRIVRSSTEAEDILQEVFLQVWHKAAMFRPQRGNVLTWLVTLARNRSIDRLRSKSRHQQLLRNPEEDMLALSDLTIPANPLQFMEAEEAGRVLRAALGKLSKSQRAIIELAYYEGLSQSEIAKELRTPLGTVKTRTRKAMMTLRESIVRHKK